MKISAPYLLFLGDESDPAFLKTAQGLADWRRPLCRGQLRLTKEALGVGLPDMTIAEAAAGDVKTLVLGVANIGGFIPDSWVGSIVEALDAGLDVASGLHTKLRSIPAINAAAERASGRITEARHPDQKYPIGSGERRSGKRLLAVGTDCAVGKMYTALAIERALHERGVAADFRATGQTGIFIAGGGVPVDAVVSDFVAGSVEWLTPAHDPDHWDIIEGQGSLFHPSYAGVSLGLLHGSQADAIVLCHDPLRMTMDGAPSYKVPSLEATIEMNLNAGRLTNPDIRCVGISVNTSRMSEGDALKYLADTEARMGLPCCDPVRTGVAKIVENLL